jgi:hypothetical protein
VRYSDLLERTEGYNRCLEDFIGTYNLPKSWFEKGVDHFAVKAYNPDDYQKTIREFRDFSFLIAESALQGRRLAAAKLLGDFAIKQNMLFSSVQMVGWIEIMEARPEDRSVDHAQLDHAEIFVPQGIIPMRSVLQSRGLYPIDESNRSHEWLSVIMKPYEEELKFSDKRLSHIVQADLKAGRATLI